MKLSLDAQTKLIETVKAFFENDGESEEESNQIAHDCLAELLEGKVRFELWDALGCDDLNLVSKTPELKNLYKSISKDMEKSKASYLN